MAVEIKKTQEGYEVNGKPVYKNLHDQWICDLELTPNEKEQFNYHLNYYEPKPKRWEY